MNNGKFIAKDNRPLREGKDDEVKIVGSRVFVGKLNPSVSRDIIENRFKKYGTIISITMHREHCFVQYEDENVGNTAVKSENNSIMFGNRIDVRMERDAIREEKAMPRFIPMQVRKRSPSSEGRRERRDMRDDQIFRQPYRDRSPIESSRNMGSRGGGSRDSFDGNFRGESDYRNTGRNEEIFKPNDPVPNRNVCGPFAPQFGRDVPPMQMDRNLDNQYDGQLGQDRNYRDQIDGRDGLANQSKFSGNRQSESQDLAPQYRVRDSYENYVDYVKPVKPNDCEIIVLNKLQRGYAEIVERRLKGFGLQVDLLFPKDNSPIMRLLRDISSRGCLYAIVILPQNEAHKSITINILHGAPQEHRNMPLEDAMNFISKNFTAYLQSKLEHRQPQSAVGGFRRDLPNDQSMLGGGGGGSGGGGGGGGIDTSYGAAPPQQMHQQQHHQRQQQLQQQHQHQQHQHQQQQQPQPMSSVGVARGVHQQPLQHLPLAGISRSSDDTAQEVKPLLRLLASEKHLTVTELDVVIKHLQDTRDRMLKVGGGNGSANTFHNSAAQEQQMQLQQTILNLFGGGNSGVGGGGGAGGNNSNTAKVGREFSGLGSMDSGGGSGSGGVGSGGGYDGRNVSVDTGNTNRRRGAGRWGPPVNQQSGTSSSAAASVTDRSSLSINLDNPNIQKALDTLIQSGGPDILQRLDKPISNVYAHDKQSQDMRYMGDGGGRGMMGDGGGGGRGMMGDGSSGGRGMMGDGGGGGGGTRGVMGIDMDIDRRHLDGDHQLGLRQQRPRDVDLHMGMSQDAQQQQPLLNRPRDVDSRTPRDIDARNHDIDSRHPNFYSRGPQPNSAMPNYGGRDQIEPQSERFHIAGMGYGSPVTVQGRPQPQQQQQQQHQQQAMQNQRPFQGLAARQGPYQQRPYY